MEKKAVGYYRVSTTGQEDNTSLETQQARVRDFCKGKGYKLVAEFSDVASGGNCNRPGYQAALDYVAENKIDVFVILKLDRVHRHQQNLLVFESNLREQGIGLVSVQEDINTTNAVGKAFFQMMGCFAEFERNTINERTKAGRHAKLNEGKSGGGKIPLGYQKVSKTGNWEIVEPEAEMIREIFRQYLKVQSLSKLAALGKKLGWKTTRGKNYSVQALHRLLTNRTYIGEYRYNSDSEKIYTTIKNHHPAIIAFSTFGKVQKALKAGNKRKR